MVLIETWEVYWMVYLNVVLVGVEMINFVNLCLRRFQERNVDVEHRFGEALGGVGSVGSVGGVGSVGAVSSASHVSRGKKKSTRCRMVFRTDIINPAGHRETLQVCSTQIICSEYLYE